MNKTIKDLRKQKNMTTDYVSEQLGISKSMLYKIENGARSPSKKNILKLSQIYNCSIDKLYIILKI